MQNSLIENIEAIERRLWSAADKLRANSDHAANEYFLPVMGLIFLRYAYSRYLAARDKVAEKLPRRNGKTRPLNKDDFSRTGALYLREESQFDYLVNLPAGKNIAAAIAKAMEGIEQDYASLRGVLPKNDYARLGNDLLGDLLRTLNPDELKSVSDDVFGRIYEYFLTRFAGDKAHDGGEFFTPVSLVSFIAHVLEPQKGIVLDPACGSGGMFVQSARALEEQGGKAAARLTFRGIEKNDTTIRLAKMNLAVHGMEGDIRQAITYYEDPHNLTGGADYVMANPPFNVDEIDAEKIRPDARLPFGLPGVNAGGQVGNGNYVWISYFYSYLKPRGRAGFVMSSQASGAGGGEAKVREQLLKTGDVDIMVAIRENFFYTRSVPCHLWFFDKGKPQQRRDKVLMLDARAISRQVTRKIHDFSPEQELNLRAIVWLYRNDTARFIKLVSEYLNTALQTAADSNTLRDFFSAADALVKTTQATQAANNTPAKGAMAAEANAPYNAAPKDTNGINDITWRLQARKAAEKSIKKLAAAAQKLNAQRNGKGAANPTAAALLKQTEKCKPLAQHSRDIIAEINRLHKTLTETSGAAMRGAKARELLKALEAAKQQAEQRLNSVSYFWQQAQWLTQRFPDGKLRDIEGLVKVVDITEIAANEWTLTPGRYVGVAPDEEDENFNYAETMRELHSELNKLDSEAATLAKKIRKNFGELV